MHTLLVIITSLLLDTASTEAYLQGQYTQPATPIEGTQSGGFGVQVQSVYDIDTVHRVFGEARYSWSQSAGNWWVENADYQLLYPYLTCDTAGGGMRSEEYWFRGGYRMARGPVLWHVALQYRALQSYRSVDPRPRNKVADLSVEGSVGYLSSRYAYSVVGQVGRYKQNNDISFYSEQGTATVYHLVQPGADYTRFAGAYTSAYYHGMTAGGAWMMQPRCEGALAGVGYSYLTVTKELSSSTAIPIAGLQVHRMTAQAGYAAPRWRAYATAEYRLRRGTQYLYGVAADNYFTLLTREANYREDRLYVALAGSYTQPLPVGVLSVEAEADCLYALPSEAVASTERFAQLADNLMATQCHALVAVRYTFPIRGRYSWFFRPEGRYTYYSTGAHGWQVALQTGLCF